MLKSTSLLSLALLIAVAVALQYKDEPFAQVISDRFLLKGAPAQAPW